MQNQEQVRLYDRLGGIDNIATGPQNYTGRSMEDSHRLLLITPEEWQAFLDDFQQTLDKFNVPQPEQTEMFAIVESTREAIVVSPV